MIHPAPRLTRINALGRWSRCSIRDFGYGSVTSRALIIKAFPVNRPPPGYISVTPKCRKHNEKKSLSRISHVTEFEPRNAGMRLRGRGHARLHILISL